MLEKGHCTVGIQKNNKQPNSGIASRSVGASLLVGVVGLLAFFQSWGGNLPLEAEYSRSINQNNLFGEVVTLQASGQSFVALYSPETSSFIHGGAIIIHDLGGHPDRSGVVANLRKSLPQHGWQTLSVQMPVYRPSVSQREQLGLIPDAQARLATAIEHLKQQGVSNVVLIGHGLGGKMVLNFLTQGAGAGTGAVQAVVMIGTSVTSLQGDTTLADIAVIKRPILDLFGSQDDDSVRHSAGLRKVAAKKANNPDYRQIEVEGADHQFSGLPSSLVSRIYAWLAKVAPGRKIEGRDK